MTWEVMSKDALNQQQTLSETMTCPSRKNSWMLKNKVVAIVAVAVAVVFPLLSYGAAISLSLSTCLLWPDF